MASYVIKCAACRACIHKLGELPSAVASRLNAALSPGSFSMVGGGEPIICQNCGHGYHNVVEAEPQPVKTKAKAPVKPAAKKAVKKRTKK